MHSTRLCRPLPIWVPRTLAAGAIGLAICFAVSAKTPSARATLVGSWRLTTYVDTPDGGDPVYAFGRNPIGLFIFTGDDHVSISIMRNPPDVSSPTSDVDPDACLPGWYCAYFGTYTVDFAKGEWITHVVGGNIPAYLNTDQRRTFTLSGEQLTIKESYLEGDRHVSGLRVLVRESGPR
jgi:hypothetical protein